MTALVQSAGASLARTRSATGRRRVALAALAFLAVTAALSFRTAANLNVPGQIGGNWAFQDFRDAIYYPVRALLDGVNPYDAVAYLGTYPVRQTFPPYAPVMLLYHLPLGFVPFEAAELLYYLAILALTLVTARVVLRACGLATDATPVLWLATAILLSRPGHQNVLVGQCTLQMVLGAYFALLYARERPTLAGLGLALSIAKPTFGVPVAFLMLWRGEARAVAIGVGIAAVLSGVVAAVLVHASGSVDLFVRALLSSYGAWSTEPTSNAASTWGRIDAVYVMERLFGEGLVTSAVVSLGILGLGALALHRVARSRDADPHLSMLLVCLTTLTCAYHQAYDLLLLTLPLTALVTSTRAAIPPASRRALVVLLLFPALNYLATLSVVRALGITGFWWLVTTSLNSVALLAALLLCVRLAFRQPR